jgi:hypothetical protein
METAAGSEPRSSRERAARERLLVPIRYALLRMRLHAPHTVLVAFGIAVGAAVLAMTAVGSSAVQDRAVQRALAQLQPSDRAIQAVWSGVPAQSSLTFLQRDGSRSVPHSPRERRANARDAWCLAQRGVGTGDGDARVCRSR